MSKNFELNYIHQHVIKKCQDTTNRHKSVTIIYQRFGKDRPDEFQHRLHGIWVAILIITN